MHSTTYLFPNLVLVDEFAASIVPDLVRGVRFDNIVIEWADNSSRRRRKGVVAARMMRHRSTCGKDLCLRTEYHRRNNSARYRIPRRELSRY